MVRFTLRCFAVTLCGSLGGLVLAAVICWVWLACIDGHELGW